MRHEARRPLRSPETKKAGNAVPIAARTHGSRRASPGRSKAIMLRHPVDHRAWDMVGGPPNLSFYQKVYVARGSCELGHERPEWALMLALNSVRNKLAHRSIRKELGINISNFRNLLREMNSKYKIDDLNGHDLIVYAVATCCGYPLILRDRLRESRGLEPLDD
jgi:hypothetical protein